MSRTQFYLMGFGVLALFDTATQVFFKLASTHAGTFTPTLQWALQVAHTPWLYGAIAGYVGSFVAWMTVLKHAPVGPAFAGSHISVIFVLVISVLYFGDHLSAIQIAGALSIVVGVGFLSLSKSEPAHD
jgi:drug/metabolite transporter (DMT)-like permease